LEVLVSAGQRHESCFFEPLLERLLAEGRTPIHLLGDKGYSAPPIRRWLSARSITPVIPHRADQHKLHPELPPVDFPRYRRRNVVERTIGFLKQCRSVATRFDKLPKCFLAIIKLAFIRLYLRKIDSSDTT
jgi:transposase